MSAEAEAEGGVDAAVKGKGKAAPLAGGGGGGRGRFVAYPPQMRGTRTWWRTSRSSGRRSRGCTRTSSLSRTPPLPTRYTPIQRFIHLLILRFNDDEKKDEAGTDAAKKTAGSDSEDDEQDAQQKKEGGLSNKQKKIQRRMKIAELKQICNRPDGVPLDESSFESIVVFMSNIFNLNA
ncbi:hypothetical protein GUJ93_ZPchr0002g26086 [Zizania palustris]|uniref:Uncharacterized protein n=1 Tax=Zizania palustris TaxID=103762 RepID=A0A8J5RSU8_ZIZPA|nr:hypothetical protein GUJ93_ZPchr0002g26086 [Zizania palustris]